MIRIRLQRSVRSIDLTEHYGFTEVHDPSGRCYYSKMVGPFEVQIKLTYPTNVRIQDWSDSRAPWILFKFLLLLEARMDISGKIRVDDDGHYKILPVEETLGVIKELSQYTDITQRLSWWYQEYLKGNLKTL